MRIEPIGQTPQIESSSPAQPDKAAHAAPSAGADQVQFSALSQAAAGLSPAALQKIQADVRAGTYQANAGQVAQRIVGFYLIPVE